MKRQDSDVLGSTLELVYDYTDIIRVILRKCPLMGKAIVCSIFSIPVELKSWHDV